MAAETNKLKLGLFVLTALAIVVAGLVLLGGSELFQPKLEAVSLFDESVQGLEVGSAVKARGVTIGQVSSIKLRAEDSYIQVNMELYLNNTGLGAHRQAEERLRREIADGAVCRMEYAGITGMKFIDIDYAHSGNVLLAEPPAGSLPPDAIYIPSAPSLLSSITSTALETMQRLAQVDVEKITDELSRAISGAADLLDNEKLDQTVTSLRSSSTKLDALLNDVQQQLGDERIATTLDTYNATGQRLQHLADKVDAQLDQAKIGETTQSLRETLSELKASLAKAETAMADAKQTMADYRQLAQTARQQLTEAELGKTSATMRDTASSFDRTADSITDAATTTRDAVRNLGGAQRDFQLTLERLNETLESIDAWVQYLDEDPSSLIRGKRKQPQFLETD